MSRAEANANAFLAYQTRYLSAHKFTTPFEMSGRVSYHHAIKKSTFTTIVGDHRNMRLLDFGIRNQEAVDNIDSTRGAMFQVKLRNETARDWVCVVQSEIVGENLGRMICPTRNIGIVTEDKLNTINLSYSLLPPAANSIRKQKDTTFIPIVVTIHTAPLFKLEEETLPFLVEKKLKLAVYTDYAPSNLKRWVVRERLDFSTTAPEKCELITTALQSMSILCELNDRQ
jgi:hypothetical protein